MDIRRCGSAASIRVSSDYFTGEVRQDPLNEMDAPGRVKIVSVTFEPGARTAWHTHPLGQTLIVTAGMGLVQLEGGAVQEIRAGDVVSIKPGERHWHGAGPRTAMTHIAVHEAIDGRSADWSDRVTDEEYAAYRG